MHVFREIYMIYNWAGWELQFRFVNCWHFLNPSENFPLLSEKEDYVSPERLEQPSFYRLNGQLEEVKLIFIKRSV